MLAKGYEDLFIGGQLAIVRGDLVVAEDGGDGRFSHSLAVECHPLTTREVAGLEVLRGGELRQWDNGGA